MRYPPDLIIRPLRRDEWHLVADRFENEYGVLMPLPDNAQHLFYGVFLGEKLVGFSHFEKLIDLSKVYLDKEHRNVHFLNALFETMDSDMTANVPVVIYPAKRFERVLKSFGYRDWEITSAWRKDY